MGDDGTRNWRPTQMNRPRHPGVLVDVVPMLGGLRCCGDQIEGRVRLAPVGHEITHHRPPGEPVAPPPSKATELGRSPPRPRTPGIGVLDDLDCPHGLDSPHRRRVSYEMTSSARERTARLT